MSISEVVYHNESSFVDISGIYSQVSRDVRIMKRSSNATHTVELFCSEPESSGLSLSISPAPMLLECESGKWETESPYERRALEPQRDIGLSVGRLLLQAQPISTPCMVEIVDSGVASKIYGLPSITSGPHNEAGTPRQGPHCTSVLLRGAS